MTGWQKRLKVRDFSSADLALWRKRELRLPGMTCCHHAPGTSGLFVCACCVFQSSHEILLFCLGLSDHKVVMSKKMLTPSVRISDPSPLDHAGKSPQIASSWGPCLSSIWEDPCPALREEWHWTWVRAEIGPHFTLSPCGNVNSSGFIRGPFLPWSRDCG